MEIKYSEIFIQQAKNFRIVRRDTFRIYPYSS